MARMARYKMEGEACWYHLSARVACKSGEYPLEGPGCKRKLIDLIRRYSRGYCCRVAAFCIMGDHSHLVSLFQRTIGKGKWLMKVKEVLSAPSERKARAEYRHLIYWRGSVPTKESHRRIPRELAEREAERGFSVGGAFLRRLRYFSEGVAVGGEVFVRQQLVKLRRAGRYRRRCRAISQRGVPHFSLREQRSHAVTT